MENLKSFVEQLKISPHARLIIEEVEHELEKESRKREEYYALVHENIKAEFINGTIQYQSPVKKAHWQISANLSSELIAHVRKHDLGVVGVEKVMVSLTRNDYEPDICFFPKEKAHAFTSMQMHFPAPAFIVEILSPSTEMIDRNEKFIDYAAHGVFEYWIVDPSAKAVEKYLNNDGEYQLDAKMKAGSINSETVKDFRISLESIFWGV